MLPFLVLSALAAAVLLFASDRAALNADFTRTSMPLRADGRPLTTSITGSA